MRRRRATIDEIAEKAGVSKTTVSNVFNSKGRFSEDIRSRVLSAATELRFTPNALIRSIQTRQTNIIGVRTWPTFADLVDSSISMYLQQGIVDGLGQTGYDLLSFIDSMKRPAPTQAVQFLDGRVDGAILGPGILSNNELQILGEAKFPAVVLYHPSPPLSVGSITIDNAQGIELAVRHLVDLGHRNIVGYFPGDSYDMEERRNSFEAVLLACGLAESSPYWFDCTDYLAPIEPFCDWLLTLPDSPTAVIFGDDHVAFQGIAALEKRGVRVPEDLSVVGFDDSPRASNGQGLTTIRQPAREVGHRAAEMVVRLIQGEATEDCHVQLPVELKVRNSTSLPGQRHQI